MALANGEKFAEHSHNGNPHREDGRPVRTWEMSDRGFRTYLRGLKEDGVTFAASEWGLPLAALEDENSFSFTILRDPISRIVSNYTFDVQGGYTSWRNVNSWQAFEGGNWARDNYYVRTLVGRDWHEDMEETEALDMALRRLGNFDAVLILEDGQLERRVRELFGWEVSASVEKKARVGLLGRCLRAARALQQGRLDLAAIRLGSMSRISARELRVLAEINSLDVKLFEVAKRRYGSP
ncbi:sulfotransferase family protein [Nocardioides sp. BSK12Z-4]|uniref:Sulfotransferase family protein n=1 Tax=Nocardioides bruguierae TaxID=2945102 RepID=A0A9X2IFZ6_9ACTN|nr:sulfotransferase family protein [Nocardioides bruguierae]